MSELIHRPVRVCVRVRSFSIQKVQVTRKFKKSKSLNPQMDTFVLAHTYAYMAHTQSGGSLGIDISYDLALALEIQSGNN